LAAGYLPLGAAIYTDKVSQAFNHVPQTGHTFTGHTACCAAGVAVQKIVMREKLVERVAANEQKLKAMIRSALQDVEAVGDVRGRGHFIAVELVENRESKKPFESERQLFLHIRAQAMENGLICYPVGGNVDGVNGDVIILAPPYNATNVELGEIVDKMAKSVKQVLAKAGLS
jgi:adenosylmethionine-8-amino-7-oxononanoate aminotransferase